MLQVFLRGLAQGKYVIAGKKSTPDTHVYIHFFLYTRHTERETVLKNLTHAVVSLHSRVYCHSNDDVLKNKITLNYCEIAAIAEREKNMVSVLRVTLITRLSSLDPTQIYFVVTLSKNIKAHGFLHIPSPFFLAIFARFCSTPYKPPRGGC